MAEDHRPVLHGPRGVADEPPESLRARVLGGWDAVLEAAAGGPSASPASSTAGGGEPEARNLRPLAALGSWPGRPVLGSVMAAAHGLPAPERRPKPFDPSPQDVRDALAEARERVVAALDEVLAAPELGRRIVDSPLGPLPVLTQIHAMGHEAAQAVLDTSGSVPPSLADAGLAAMVDVVGALAWRARIPASAGLWEPDGGLGWVFAADADGWRVRRREAGDDLPGVEGAARHLLVSTGSVPTMLARGEIRMRRVGGLLALAPLVDQVPNLPGGPLLRKAVGAVSLLSRLPGLR
ncbi:DinB family protein [Streptacidiphilus neutrinimicus]|uniref:DinB family protein n=1 Tax=Streptacidiphilus neutrinimicus TaxID=105420 RepID=UPI0005A89418|nr:DinB family protein [Streptacidiphilus neutrinimicus]